MADRAAILGAVRDYATALAQDAFVPGSSPVRASGRCLSADDYVALVDAGLDAWLTSGRFAESFAKGLQAFLGVRHALLVNSGSSANLLAVAALTAPSLLERRLAPGDEVITVACGFPTTVAPLIQYGAVPVFLDVTIPQYNVDVAALEAALSPRTRAVVLAHTLGNPFDLAAVTTFCARHGLWLIEDCCDALGSRYEGRPCGTFGDLATSSFYPAHHITTGEGGAVYTQSPKLKKLVESFRDWGRDCWCEPGDEGTCGKRYEWQLGELPLGYDHKYIYSHLGYNLKLTDMQAAVGVSQLAKLPRFIDQRRTNFRTLRELLSPLQEHLVLPEPCPQSEPSWFGFPVTLRGDRVPRRRLLAHLEAKKIGTRLLFAGNMLRQPAMQGVRHRQIGDLARTDEVMERSFWLGVYPALGERELTYVADTLAEFLASGTT
jgi:CDP-6-deoxy-D-xylo-4-hexulose-3-dehydrase